MTFIINEDKQNKDELKKEKESSKKESKKNFFYPNEFLSDIIYNFNEYQKNYEKRIQEEPELKREWSETNEKNKNYLNKEVLKDGIDYKVLLINNACKDKGSIRDEVLIKISNALEFKGHIQTTCKNCNLKIRPSLLFIHVNLDKSQQIGFYSLGYSYMNVIEILNSFLTNRVLEKKKVDDEIFTLTGNMIYYLTSSSNNCEICNGNSKSCSCSIRKEKAAKLCNFLATSIK